MICNMKRLLQLWGKYLVCVRHNYLYYCYFNMASAARNMKAAATYKCKLTEEWSKQYPISRNCGNPYAFYCIPWKKSVKSVKSVIAVKGCQM